MIRAKGLIYRTIEDVTNVLYKTEVAKFLDTQIITNGFSPQIVTDDNLKIIVDTANIPYFLGRFKIYIIPQNIIVNFFYLYYLKLMRENPVMRQTISDNEKHQYNLADFFEKTEEDIKDFFNIESGAYYNKDKKIEEQPCIIWIYNCDNEEEEFIGTYSGIPIRLFEKPLNSTIIYDCSFCDNFEVTSGDIPDLYYDKNHNLYCKNCKEQDKSNMKLKHLGE